MRLSDASVAIRPRTAWEAMDLGVLMAREHRLLLMGSWALVTLPVFAVLTALLWKYPSTAMFLFWLLKPAFDRLPLYILSKALFGETPSIKHAVRQWAAPAQAATVGQPDRAPLQSEPQLCDAGQPARRPGWARTPKTTGCTAAT